MSPDPFAVPTVADRSYRFCVSVTRFAGYDGVAVHATFSVDTREGRSSSHRLVSCA